LTTCASYHNRGAQPSGSAKSGSHLSEISETEDKLPPVTPATALSVLPLHAAVAAGKVEAVRVWWGCTLSRSFTPCSYRTS
jgi:hypothetical protein